MGVSPLPHPPLALPPLTNLGCTTVTGIDQENAVFRHKFWKISLPWEGETPPTPSPRSVASLPRFGPPLTNPGCTTVTGIAKGTRGHAPAPLIGVMPFSYTNFQKISLGYRGRGGGGGHTPPPLARILPPPLRLNPGYATVTWRPQLQEVALRCKKN